MIHYTETGMQTLKPELRERVLAAAEAEFAESGYRGATMAAIAARAGMSTGNLYRYFANKDDLFETIFTDAFADTFLALLRKRVRSLTVSRDLEALGADAREDAAALLRFFVEHRTKVVVLLARAEDSRFASFRERFVAELVRPTEATLRADAGGRRLTKPERLVVENVFENTVRTIVAILERARTPQEIEQSFAGFWSYQLAGLAGLKRWVMQ
jgi:AcrR family transcriptional regulator